MKFFLWQINRPEDCTLVFVIKNRFSIFASFTLISLENVKQNSIYDQKGKKKRKSSKATIVPVYLPSTNANNLLCGKSHQEKFGWLVFFSSTIEALNEKNQKEKL